MLSSMFFDDALGRVGRTAIDNDDLGRRQCLLQ